MYRHWRVNRTALKSKRVVQVMFSLLHGEPDMLPPVWAKRAGTAGSPEAARTVCDWHRRHDRQFALEEHRRLTDPNIPG